MTMEERLERHNTVAFEEGERGYEPRNEGGVQKPKRQGKVGPRASRKPTTK